MKYSIKNQERSGYEIFSTTIGGRHPEWTITSTNKLESEEPSYERYDAFVVTGEEKRYEIEIKKRIDWGIDAFDDLEIDEHKVLDLQNDLRDNKCERAFICGIYEDDGVMLFWEIDKNKVYDINIRMRPEMTVGENGKKEKKYIPKPMVSFPIEEKRKIRINTDKDEQ